MIETSWVTLREHLQGTGRQLSTTGKGLLEQETALDKMLEAVREMSAEHPGGYGAFREGALEGLLRLAITQDFKLDVRPLVALGFGELSDTAARRPWHKVLGRDLYHALDEMVSCVQRWQRQFVVDLTHRVDVAKLAELWTRQPVRISAFTASLRHQRGHQSGLAQALGIEGARVIWKRAG